MLVTFFNDLKVFRKCLDLTALERKIPAIAWIGSEANRLILEHQFANQIHFFAILRSLRGRKTTQIDKN